MIQFNPGQGSIFYCREVLACPGKYRRGFKTDFYHLRSGVVKLCLSLLLLLDLGGRLSVLVPAFELDAENDSVWVNYFLTTPLQGCVRTFLIFLSNLNI